MDYMTAEIMEKTLSSNVFYFKWEFIVLEWFQNIHNGVLDVIVPAITHLGDSGIFWILLTLVLLIIPKTRKVGFASFIGLFFSVLFTNIILKHAFVRCRPCWLYYLDDYKNLVPAYLGKVKYLVSFPSDYSFPSGHSSASFAGATAIFAALKDNKKRWVGALLLVLAALIALSRLYVGVHWPTDVIVGSIVGIISGALGCYLMKQINLYFLRKDLGVGL